MGNLFSNIWRNRDDDLLLPTTNINTNNKLFLRDDIFNSVANIEDIENMGNIKSISSSKYDKRTIYNEIENIKHQITILANSYNELDGKINKIATQYELLINRLQNNNININERIQTITTDMEILICNDKVLSDKIENINSTINATINSTINSTINANINTSDFNSNIDE